MTKNGHSVDWHQWYHAVQGPLRPAGCTAALLDTVWLATSTKQIRDLWQSGAQLLEEQPTPLQEATLSQEVIDE